MTLDAIKLPGAFILLTLFWAQSCWGQSLGLNNASPDASSIIDMTATDRGMLAPRMTQAQRNAITSPATSLLIYQTDNTPGFYYNAGTPGAPNWVAVQPPVSQVSATGTTTTTSTTDVLINSMTITVAGSGSYMIMFSGSVENSANSTNFVSIYVNGTQVAHSQRRMVVVTQTQGAAFPIATQCYVTGVTAGQTIEARWRVTAGTATMYNRTLDIIKMN